MEIKTARYYYCILIRMSMIKDFQFQMLARMQSNWNSPAGRNLKMVQPLQKTVRRFLSKCVPRCDPAIPLPGIYPKVMKAHIHTKTRQQLDGQINCGYNGLLHSYEKE